MVFSFGHSSNDGFETSSCNKVNIRNFSFLQKFLFFDPYRRNIDIPTKVLYNRVKPKTVFYGKSSFTGCEIVLN